MEILSPVMAGTFAPATGFSRRRSRFASPVYLKRRWTSIPRSKSSNFQDFRGFAKPVRLLPATQVEDWRNIAYEEESKFITVDGSQSLYRLRVCTSRSYGSGLSDVSAGVLLCIIDENGDSIMQRIPALSMTGSSSSSHFDEELDADRLRFQRGSVDEFAFSGHQLGKHLSVWMGTESVPVFAHDNCYPLYGLSLDHSTGRMSLSIIASVVVIPELRPDFKICILLLRRSGQWKITGFSLSAAHPCQDSSEELSLAECTFRVYRYDFEAEETLIGGSSDSSMIELRASRVTETYGQDPFCLLAESFDETIPPNPLVSADESMREYSDLKLSLLLYDAVLISAGGMLTSITGGENAALAFLTGGLGGFLYLMLIQRSVDELTAPASLSRSTIDEALSQFRGPVLSIALAITLTVVTLKFGSGVSPVSFAPMDLILGMIGFLMCKVAVVLAAFKTISVRPNPND